MAATATDERAVLIERWVYLDAFEVLLHNLVVTAPDEPAFVELWPSELIDENLELDLGADAIATQLWPTEEEYDHSLEARVAHARSDSILAGLFAILATDEGRNSCAANAARFAAIAARTLAGEAA
jgi:hypothetical protein